MAQNMKNEPPKKSGIQPAYIEKEQKKQQEREKRESRKEQLNEIKNVIRAEDLLLVLYILKKRSDYEHALSSPQITELLNQLIPAGDMNQELFSERTIRRKLDPFIVEDKDPAAGIKEELNKILPSLVGGTVEYRAADGIEKGINLSGNGSQKRYYFEPVLDESDLNLIYGALMSSRYLSDAEKQYLLSRLSLLQPRYTAIGEDPVSEEISAIRDIDALPGRPTVSGQSSLPMESSKLLKNVQTLYDAISLEEQVEIVYGVYDYKMGGKVDFHKRHPDDSPHILNPYAMIWNDGEYYLIAVKEGESHPRHYRVDRIMTAAPHFDPDSNGEPVVKKRAPIPDSLKPFFTRSNGTRVFDGIKYANTYPSMIFYHEKNQVDCRFECTDRTLQILIDYFGADIRLAESDLDHSDEEPDEYNGDRYLIATVHNVQWENAVNFCLHYARYITLLEPTEMIREVRDHMKAIRKRYKANL